MHIKSPVVIFTHEENDDNVDTTDWKMITKIVFVLLACTVQQTVHGAVKCTRDFRKVGCFVRDLKLIPHLLITDLDPTHKNFSTTVDWENYAGSLHSLACRCREKARGHYKYFGIGMYGECSGGKDNAALEKLFKNPTKSPLSCINGEQQNCNVADVSECAGAVDNDFFYEIVEGDCSVKIAKGDVLNAFPKQTQVVRNTLITTLSKIGVVYEVSMEVYPTRFRATWANVFHMTVGGENGIYGDRIPGIWFQPSSASAKTNRLFICNAISGSVNHCYSSEPLPLNKWVKIRINQAKYSGYQYTIYINDKKMHQTTNTRPISFDNVKVYAGDPWCPPQIGYIRNLKIAENCYDLPTTEKDGKITIPTESVLKQNTLIGEISELCKEYQVSFDVKPTAYASGWHSVLHLTLGGNHFIYGDRTPGVWFHPSATSAALNALHICAPVSRNRNYCYNSQQFPKNQWISVKVSQEMVKTDYYYRVYINGKLVHQVINTQPMDFYDVKVYAADPWYPAQAGSIRNIIINGECKSKPSIGNMKNLLINQTSIVKNKLITTLPHVGKEYEISLEVYPTGLHTFWSSVLHLTISTNHGIYGERIPAIWFSKSKTSLNKILVYICNAVNGDPNVCYISTELPIYKWMSLKVSQENVDSKYIFKIFINDEQVYKVVNTRPVTFNDVKVYAGDPWHNAQAGYIRNLVLPESFFEKAPSGSKLSIPAETVIKKGILIGTLSTLCKEYQVSLEVKATSFAAGWHSVFHVTLGGDLHTVYGDRTPGIWFYPSSSAAKTNFLHICSPISRIANSCFNTKQLPKNDWIKIVIGQFMSRGDYYYSIDINGKRVHMVKNTLPMVFSDLVVYAGDPWYLSQAGSIRNLHIDGGKC